MARVSSSTGDKVKTDKTKDDPTERDVMEAMDIVSKTQFAASVGVSQLKSDHRHELWGPGQEGR